MSATTHVPDVAYVPTERYPHRPVCSCGWASPVGYVAAHAARTVAEYHATPKESRLP